MPTIDQLIVWVVIGLLGGTLAAIITTRRLRGHGVLGNLVVGLAGALVGGLLFRLVNVFPALDKVAFSLRDVVAALIGSLVVLAALWLWRRPRKLRDAPPGVVS